MLESIFFHPWVWIIGVLLGILTLFALFAIIRGIFTNSYSDVDWIMSGSLAALVVLVLGGLYFGFMLPPYDATYYQTYKISGEITELEMAFEDGSGTMSQTFVVKVDGVDEYIRSDDMRFRTLTVGDEANFVCVKGFAYFQEPWYDCSFAG